MNMENAMERKLTLTDLPLDIQVEVFKYLTLEELTQAIRLTCKLWYQLSHEHVFWKTLDTDLFKWISFSTGSFMKLFAQISRSIEVLKVNEEKLLKLCYVDMEGITCPNLKELWIKRPFSVFSKGHLRAMNNLSEEYTSLKAFHIAGPMIFRRLSSMTDNVVCPEQVSLFANLFPGIEEFSIGDHRTEYHEDLGIIDTFLKTHLNLKRVEILNFQLRSETLQFLLEQMPLSEKLTLENCCLLSIYEDLQNIESRLDNLRELDLTTCVVSDEFMNKVLQSVKKLEKLNLKGVQNLTNVGLEAVADTCPGLKYLILDYSTGEAKSNITDAGIERVVEKCHLLKVLNLSNCVELTDRSIQVVAAYSPNLQELYLTNILSLSDTAIISIAEKCPTLRILDICYCAKLTGASVSYVLKNCKSLYTLAAESCHRVSDINLTDLTVSSKLGNEKYKDSSKEYGQQTENRHARESGELEVSDTMETEQLQGFLDEIRSSGRESQSTSTSDGSMAVQTNGATLPAQLSREEICEEELLTSLTVHSHVRELAFNFCSNLTNACMIQISTFCKDLRDLNIQACPFVTDAGIKSLVRGCKYLKILNISGGSISQRSRLTDKSLMEISQHCRYLEELHICKNNNITSTTLSCVLVNCNKLHKVYVDIYNQGLTRISLLNIVGELKDKTTSFKIIQSTAEICLYKNKELDILTGK